MVQDNLPEKQQSLTREDLYKLVWSTPFATLSKKYDLSNIALRKLCMLMEIPLPKNGHWQQAKFGKQDKQPQLQYPYNGDAKVTLPLRQVSKEDSPMSNSDSKRADAVPNRLTQPHPHIIRAKAVLEKAEPTNYRYLHLLSCNFESLDIKVTKANIGRALRFMDSLIKALEKMGHELELNNRKTYVILGGSSYQILLREKTRRVTDLPGRFGTTEYLPTGILSLSVGIGLFREFNDGRLTLEEQLPAILEHMKALHKDRLALRLSQRMKVDAELEKQAILQEVADRKQKEITDFNALLEKAERWHKADDLRRYIDEVEKRAESAGHINEENQRWLEWARQKADWYDPFVEKEDELLPISRSSID
jgi:hypothetical protein